MSSVKLKNTVKLKRFKLPASFPDKIVIFFTALIVFKIVYSLEHEM